MTELATTSTITFSFLECIAHTRWGGSTSTRVTTSIVSRGVASFMAESARISPVAFAYDVIIFIIALFLNQCTSGRLTFLECIANIAASPSRCSTVVSGLPFTIVGEPA